MDENSIHFTKWKRFDPLEEFSRRLVEKIGPRIPFQVTKGGGQFSVFADGMEVTHFADFSLLRIEYQGRLSKIERIKWALRWPFQAGKSTSYVILVRREPDPGFLAKDYSLYLRINDCPEIEETVLSVCDEFKDRFTGGIYIYSETSPGKKQPEKKQISLR